MGGCDGRVVTKSFATRKAADAWSTQVAHDKLKGVAIDPRSGTELFADYARSWLDTRRVKGRPLAPKTLELYGLLLRVHIGPRSPTASWAPSPRRPSAAGTPRCRATPAP